MQSLHSRSFLNKVIYLVCLLLICICLSPNRLFAADFAVTSPWIGMIASFIGGDKTSIHYLSNWDSNGNVVVISRPRSNEKIIALDVKDALRFKIYKGNKNLYLLYETLPMTELQLISAFFDPAMLPFLAQSVMKIMAEADKTKYSYYQRRLAEFQSRIESTIDIGRYLLGDTKVLDLTGAEGSWLRSSVKGVVRAPENVWDVWKKGDHNALKAALDEAEKRNWLIVLDPWTPHNIRTVAVFYRNRLTLPPPSKDQDYFVYLHDILLSIWNMTKKIKTN